MDLNEAVKKVRKPRKSRAKFREGEYVKIVNPEFFVRCGYPLTLEMAEEHVVSNYGPQIEDLLAKVTENDLAKYAVSIPVSSVQARAHHYAKAKRDVIRGLAYAYVQQKNFGGRERSIYTKRVEEYADRSFLISRVKYVMTGKYYGPSGGYDSWSGEYDYEPGGLQNQKSHRILVLCGSLWDGELMIEDIHVEKEQAII